MDGLRLVLIFNLYNVEVGIDSKLIWLQYNNDVKVIWTKQDAWEEAKITAMSLQVADGLAQIGAKGLSQDFLYNFMTYHG